MPEQATISADVLARYAAEAAAGVEGVAGISARRFPRHQRVRVVERPDGGTEIELCLDVLRGESVPAVGRAVQERVADYLRKMAGVRPTAVNIVVEDVVEPAP